MYRHVNKPFKLVNVIISDDRVLCDLWESKHGDDKLLCKHWSCSIKYFYDNYEAY